MRKEVYICDRCGVNLDNTVPYTLQLTALSIQDQLEWHYCCNCWQKVKDTLGGGKITTWAKTGNYYYSVI